MLIDLGFDETAAYMVFQAQQSPPVTINFYDAVQSVSHSVVLELGQILYFFLVIP